MPFKLLIMTIILLVSLNSEAMSPEALKPEVDRALPVVASEKEKNAEFNHDDKELAPDFTLPEVNGGEFTLSSLRGQYVILDFWGTWCGWCLKAMPKMKEYHAKYKDKFVLVGVDCGDATAKWKAAVQVLQLPWTNVQVGRDNSVSRMYNVKGFPTKVIIDPNGYIVKTINGEDPRFYQLLDKMFK
ncbi:MAG: TlpA family protein disulfide reductase [Prevotella sp.]|nr:TlpA family protein disulfide reductase [Candidatus Prevotella equi]